ncbi:MAG: substrate-binding domain-containing protein, partial [Actinomycetota bacterium]
MSRRFSLPGHLWALLLLCMGIVGVGCGEPAAPAGSGSPRDALRIAAASDLRFAMDDLEAGFMKAGGTLPVQPVFASSGTLFAQASGRAPFDIFLSADMAYAQKVHAKGLAHAEGPFEYAV